MGKLANLMLKGVSKSKYSDPGSPIVNIQINRIIIPNTLIDLRGVLNVMTHETMELRVGIPYIDPYNVTTCRSIHYEIG